MAAGSVRDGSNCLQIALESGDLDFTTANTLLQALRMREAIQRTIERQGKQAGTPKSFRLYQVPASYLLTTACPPNVTQVVVNT
jgi:hypothetical protein